MTDRITIKLPEGVEYEHPDVQRLLAEIAAVKPLPPKLTAREQLAISIREAYGSHNRIDIADWEHTAPHLRASCLAEADAAIAFFHSIVDDAHQSFSGETNFSRMNGVLDMVVKIREALYK